MRFTRRASAQWKGSGMEGSGTLTTPSKVLNKTPYSYHTRFEDEPGTNPEELVGAAHAGCFAMALSGQLGNAGLTAERLEVMFPDEHRFSFEHSPLGGLRVVVEIPSGNDVRGNDVARLDRR